MGWMGFLWIVVLIACIVFVVWLLGSMTGGRGNRGSPEEVLKMRYARGEISKEDLERALEQLRR